MNEVIYNGEKVLYNSRIARDMGIHAAIIHEKINENKRKLKGLHQDEVIDFIHKNISSMQKQEIADALIYLVFNGLINIDEQAIFKDIIA